MAYVTEKLAALADPTRLAVFERLAKSPAAVHQIADEFTVSRPAISQHLRVLKGARLVLDEAVATSNGTAKVATDYGLKSINQVVGLTCWVRTPNS